MRFANDFIFGGATAAYQCEGSTREYGKGKVAWDDFFGRKRSFFKQIQQVIFNHQYPVDLKLCKMFGINGIRISIAWSRIFLMVQEKSINKVLISIIKLFKEMS